MRRGCDEPRALHGSEDLGWVEADSYHTILVELSEDFKKRLTAAYAEHPHWSKIMDAVLKSQTRRAADAGASTAMVRYRDGVDPLDGDEYNSQGVDTEIEKSAEVNNAGSWPAEGPRFFDFSVGRENSPLGLRFFERHGLLYFRDFEGGRDRLCIPTTMEKEAFKHAHDDHHHQGFDRCYDHLRSSVYIHRLQHHLTKYIAHCEPC